MELFVKTVIYRNAPAEVEENGRNELRQKFPGISFRFINEHPDVIFFLSGGSEQDAVKLLQPGKYYLLLAGFGHNAWAAATEVKAWADGKGIASMLVSMQQATDSTVLHDYAKICQAYKLLQGRQAGLIGNVSHWLVASAFPLDLAKERFGISIKHLQWGKLPDYLSFDPDPEFLELFELRGHEHLDNEARVYSFLKMALKENLLNGITLECFDMVNDRAVTACLALAMLNSSGIVAGCEGDLVSLTGMMLVQALTGTIPWMANIASINDSKVLFAHCTAPLDLLNHFELRTHFETGKSAAVQGNMKMKEVTVFRLNQTLDKAFIANGRIVSRPQHRFACRTQSEIEMPARALAVLCDRPLGNHHLIIPGNHQKLLRWACECKYIKVI
jgi:L-fucose isomerase-like protein